MPVVNTTYNFNQPNMNFGQSLLYGIFGSLTGGMGCFGGGNGYGGYGMGMGGSLFSMVGSGIGGYSYGGYGYGGYGCGCGTFNTDAISSYADTMFGVQLGTTFLQSAIYGISKAFLGRGGNGNGGSTSSKIADIESYANKYLDTLNKNGKNYSLDNNDFKNAKVEEKYNTAITSAENAITDKLTNLNKELLDLGEKPTSVELKTGENTDSSAYKERLAAAQTKWQEAKAKIDAEIKILTDKTDTSNKLVNKLKEAKDAKSAREQAINAAIELLNPLKDAYDKLVVQQKAEKEAKIYDDADGNWLNRASKTKVDKYDSGECSKSVVRKAFNLFIENKDSDINKAKNYAKKIIEMKKGNETLFANDYRSAYEQVTAWCKKNRMNIND